MNLARWNPSTCCRQALQSAKLV